MKIDRRENVNFIVTNYKIDLYHKLQLPIRMCFFFSNYRLLFPSFLLLTLSMCFFAGKDPAQKLLF